MTRQNRHHDQLSTAIGGLIGMPLGLILWAALIIFAFCF